jgi:glycosyltransferase involved in cell wall biosynthesis
MEAFPLVLKKAPRAKLIVAGANHYTKPGYWESIRASLPPGLPVEFRGYVPEEAVAELFQTASIVVLPYDSSTGSSGPAHQACEFGVPIVCAGIPDFRTMAENEDLAIRFYKVGDTNDLAEQLVAVLQSPKLEHAMAMQNYAAGVEMNITYVVSNYLRWFELTKCKELLRKGKQFLQPELSLDALRERSPV